MTEIEVRIPVRMDDHTRRRCSQFHDYARLRSLTEQARYMEKMFKVPKDQTLWMTVYDGKRNPIHIVTSDRARTKYHLYKVVDGKPSKVKTADSPAAFSEEIGFDL